MPKYQFKKYSVSISPEGEIKVSSGDTISGYCAAIYQSSPASTRPHWYEFGRKGNTGEIKPLLNPNKIRVGESLYHIPSARKTSQLKEVDINQTAIKLERLKMLKVDGIEMYDNILKSLRAQKKEVDNFSLGVDMAAVVATAAITGWGQVAKAFKSSANVVDDVSKAILKRSWGFGFQPQNQGMVQGIGQNIFNDGDNLKPNADDHTAIAIGKILVGSFIDMTSPSFWSKKLAGGDPKDELDKAIVMNENNRKAFLRTIDRSIQQCTKLLVHSQKNRE